jgi:hypothetical protein
MYGGVRRFFWGSPSRPPPRSTSHHTTRQTPGASLKSQVACTVTSIVRTANTTYDAVRQEQSQQPGLIAVLLAKASLQLGRGDEQLIDSRC